MNTDDPEKEVSLEDFIQETERVFSLQEKAISCLEETLKLSEEKAKYLEGINASLERQVEMLENALAERQ